VVSQSGLLNLAEAERQDLSSGAVSNLMGGSSSKYPLRHKYADPMSALPLDLPVHVVHAAADGDVPLSQSEAYVAAGRTAQSPPQLTMVPGDHYALIDPRSAAYKKCRELVQVLMGQPARASGARFSGRV
jgi:hypothetical protein